MHGRADVIVHRKNGRQRVDYFHRSPLRIFMPENHSGNVESEIVLANTSGGLVGGDELQVNVVMGEGTRSVITSQAAEKAYRANGADTIIETNLKLDAGSRLRWVPQETILFDGVRLRRRTVLDVDAQAAAIAGELLIFGRSASGEGFTRGLVHDEWRVKFGGKMAWADNLHLAGDVARQMESPHGFDQAKAMATLLYVSKDALERVDCVKSLIRTDRCRSGATLIGNVVIARWLGRDPAEVRRAYAGFIANFASALGWTDKGLPAIWSV